MLFQSKLNNLHVTFCNQRLFFFHILSIKSIIYILSSMQLVDKTIQDRDKYEKVQSAN